MKVGYARVSNKDPAASIQIDALKQAGCPHIFSDKVDSTGKDSPGLETALKHMDKGDTLVVYRLERLGRSLANLLSTVNRLGKLGFGFQSLQDSIDTTSGGQFIYQIFATLSEFERAIIRERTKVGLEAARAMGRMGGRPKGLSEKAQNTAAIAEKLYQEQDQTVMEICKQLSISKPTFYNYLRHRGVTVGAPREKTS